MHVVHGHAMEQTPDDLGTTVAETKNLQHSSQVSIVCAFTMKTAEAISLYSSSGVRRCIGGNLFSDITYICLFLRV